LWSGGDCGVVEKAMARKLRLEFEGAAYHVLNRGNYRRSLFESKGAAAAFERCLDETCKRFGWRVHAFVIMRNHFHLALETPQPNLSDGMKYLQGTWSNRFNRFRHEQGRPFQGRYKALHVELGHAVAQVAHYIHLNPLRAGCTSMVALRAFRWSSLWWFGQQKRPAWLVADTVLADAGALADSRAGWQRYLDFLDVLAEEAPEVRQRKFDTMCRGWAVGTKPFRDALIRDLREKEISLHRAVRLGDSGGERQRLRSDIWRERLEFAAHTAGLELDRLGSRKSAQSKVVLAALMKLTTDVSNRWLTEQLDMGTPASAGEFVRRFMRLRAEEPGFKSLLLRVAT
jgi:REP element-mobilizing transposase RayT